MLKLNVLDGLVPAAQPSGREEAEAEARPALAPMLGVCTHPGCSTVVFGHGTCIAHDPPPAARLTETQ